MAEARYRLRAAALTGGGALGVHEARYLLAFGADSGEQLVRQGHAYLPFASAAVVALLALAGGQLLYALRRARRSGGAVEPACPPRWKLWLAASAALLAVHAGQELLEGMLSPGHPAGAAALATNGGWLCVPLALGFGALVALGLRGAELAVRLAAGRRPSRPLRSSTPAARPQARGLARTYSPLAAKLAGRAPPVCG